MNRKLLKALSIAVALLLVVIMIMGSLSAADSFHNCCEEHCFLCSISSLAERICPFFTSALITEICIIVALFSEKEITSSIQKIKNPVFLKVKINC